MHAQIGSALPRSVEKHRALAAWGFGDSDHEQDVPIDWFASHALANKDVGADLLRVLQTIPKIAFDLVDIGNATKIE
jgi:hypothetical protein